MQLLGKNGYYEVLVFLPDILLLVERGLRVRGAVEEDTGGMMGVITEGEVRENLLSAGLSGIVFPTLGSENTQK